MDDIYLPSCFKTSSIYCQKKVKVIEYQGKNTPERRIDIEMKNKTISLVIGLVPEQQLFRNYINLVDSNKYINDTNMQGLMIDYRTAQNISSIWQKGQF